MGWQNNPFGFAEFAHCQTARVRWAGVHFRIRIRLAKDKRFILKMQLCCLAQEVKIKLTKIDRKIDRGAFDDVFTNIRLKRPQRILEKERCDRFFVSPGWRSRAPAQTLVPTPYNIKVTLSKRPFCRRFRKVLAGWARRYSVQIPEMPFCIVRSNHKFDVYLL